MTITDILSNNAKMYPDKTALVERDPAKKKRKTITWKEFDSISNSFANALIKKGIKKNDKVILLMTNCIEWLPVYFGILKIGALAVPLNFRFFSEKIKKCAEISSAKVFIFGKEFIDRIDKIQVFLDRTVETYIFFGPHDKCPEYANHHDSFIASANDSTNSPDIKITLKDEAALYFTSGTTGNPKAVLLTHGNLEFACRVENEHHKQNHDDNFLCIPPLYHTGAKMHWFGNFIVGAKSVILKGLKPKWIIEAISEEKITIAWLLVPWAYDILSAIENNEIDLKNYNLDQWHLMHIGAQPVPSDLIEKWKKIFPNHSYDTNYGLTEATGPGCVHLGMKNLHKIGAIGVPGFKWECKIVDKKLNEIPFDEPGELMIKGPGVMKEYYKNPEETQKTLVNGWLLTGDIARMDKDGFIWLMDRKKDIIITGGENIYPVEVEDFIITHDKVKDVGVIGLPDNRLGEIVTAIITPKPGVVLTEEEIKIYCEKMPRYRRPKKIVFDHVPRNPTGKIEKPELRKKYY